MNTADFALIVSIVSLLFSILGFIWNVWSKFIFPKPQIQLSVAVTCLVSESSASEEFVTLSAANHGPGEVTLKMAMALMRKGWFRRSKFGILKPFHHFPAKKSTIGPFSGGLPKKLAVGEEFSSYFPLSQMWIDDGIFRIGFVDTFSRYHWCSKKDTKRFVARLKDAIAGVPTSNNTDHG